MAEPFIVFEKVQLTRGADELFCNLNLTLERGQTVLVEGGNLAGKTSLLRALQRDPADCPTLSGSLRFQGTEILTLPDQRYREHVLKRWGFLSENAAATLFPNEPVRTQIGVGRRASPDDLDTLLANLGFSEPGPVLDARASELSLGSRTALAMLIAVLNRPDVLVVDDFVLERDPLGADLCLWELRRRVSGGLALIVLCRSSASYAELKPSAVVRLQAGRGLGPPSFKALASLEPATSPSQRAEPHKALLRAEHLTTLLSRHPRWLQKPVTVVALDQLSFELASGEWLTMIGASPSGKTTLALTLVRLIEPSFGGVALRSKRGHASKDPRGRILICFEEARASFDPRYTVGQVLEEAQQSPGNPGTGVEARTAAALASVGLHHSLLHRPCQQLSASETQLLALARALLGAPSVLVLDNAFSQLEAQHRERMMRLIKQAARPLGVICFSHDIPALSGQADRVGVMYAGRLVELARARDLLQHQYHPFTRVLLAARRSGPRKLQLVAEGGTPDQSRSPKGCAYHPRCPRVEPGRCDEEAPRLLSIGTTSDHRVACWHPFV